MRVTHTGVNVRGLAGPIALVFALGVSVTTCRLDKLINPASANRLVVNPDSLVDSAHVGSLKAETTFVRVANADGVTIPWTATKSAAWVTLTRAADSLIVMLHPDTLSQTLHRDTIVFTSTQITGTVRVPIAFNMLPPAAELSVTPVSKAETAFAGSALPDTFSLTIDNTGALPLTWSAVVDSSWISVSKDSGGAPPTDRSLVTLTPGSLPPGTHSGAITVTAPGAIGSPITVPVTLTLKPCVEASITLDTVVTGSIAASDCGAPQRAGRQAKLYAVQANAGDTLSFRLTSPDFNAYLVLTNKSGVAILAENDDCGAPVGTSCIQDFIVSTTDRYLVEVTTKDSAETGAFTLSATKELSPIQPAPGQYRADGTTAIPVGAVTPESTVVFKATVNDPNPHDSVRLEVEVEGLASGPLTHTSPLVPRGTPVALPVTNLHDDEGYHWRARTCDKTSRCSTWFNFGGNVDPAADFIVNSIPEPPDAPGSPDQFNGVGITQIPSGGGTGGGLGSTQTVTFRAVVTDPDPGDVISIEVEAKDVGAAFDGVATRGVAVASGNTASVSLNFTAPLLGQNNYYWRARACDQTGLCGAWVSFGGPAGDSPPRVTDFHVP